MSLKRKCFELKRMLRHRSFLFLIFAVVMVMFVLSVAYSQDHPGESHHEHEDHARALNNKGGDDRPAGVERRDAKANDDDDIGAKADPYTIFKRGEAGNYEPKEAELIRDAPGEQGKAVVHDGNAPEVHKANSEFGFNTFVSDMISLNRTIPDTRDTECKYWHYPEKLPTASVVVVFHNEGWTPLMRTVHSVLLRSPPHLLHEVLMVDDFSDKEHLKSRLDKYLEQFNGKVRLVRNSEREGLIRARSIGAQNARGDVVVFLDAHCEANVNWLPPLLAPIANDRRVMTVPIIDGIDMNTWSYRRQYAGASALFRGIFEWGLLYKETELPAEEKNRRKYPTEPFRSPTHAGGLFAIDRKWFSELGYYDSGLQIWGGEQYELSFKIWQCGGGILFVPCSHVGHVYRNRMPYGFGKLSGKPVIATNLKRVVESWMDEYGKYYYIREPMNAKRDPGDLTAARAIREKNNCKSFKWYVICVSPLID
uniref:Glycosyltransferase 2-like domain-containing protein n=1 Tax=Plectus sambesii TaxID=2011161 RepID=A0A914WAL2_9BILA